jgi:flagellin-like protein
MTTKTKTASAKKGVSPIISTVMIIAITFAAIGIVMTIAVPAIDRAKEASLLNEAAQNMQVIDNMVREVASEGTGSLRTMQLKSTGGEYRVDEKTNAVYFSYVIKHGMVEIGTFVRDGNLLLVSGAEAKASEYDINGDGTIELVLENEIMRVAIQRLGSESSQVPIDTSNNIKLLNFKENNANITPTDTSIALDDQPDTISGTGYSELVKSGEHLAKAEAVVHVNSTNINYDILYTLQAGADFLTAEIKNAYYN